MGLCTLAMSKECCSFVHTYDVHVHVRACPYHQSGLVVQILFLLYTPIACIGVVPSIYKMNTKCVELPRAFPSTRHEDFRSPGKTFRSNGSAGPTS